MADLVLGFETERVVVCDDCAAEHSSSVGEVIVDGVSVFPYEVFIDHEDHTFVYCVQMTDGAVITSVTVEDEENSGAMVWPVRTARAYLQGEVLEREVALARPDLGLYWEIWDFLSATSQTALIHQPIPYVDAEWVLLNGAGETVATILTSEFGEDKYYKGRVVSSTPEYMQFVEGMFDYVNERYEDSKLSEYGLMFEYYDSLGYRFVTAHGLNVYGWFVFLNDDAPDEVEFLAFA